MFVPSAGERHIVPFGNILRRTKAIDIIGLIKVLPEERERGERGFLVIEPEIIGFADLVRYGIEGVATTATAETPPASA